MLYIREPKPLHEQHIEHMLTTGLPYDNLVRCFQRYPFRLRSIINRIKNAGFRSFFNYLFGSRKDFRLSGLHFIAVTSYYNTLDAEHRFKYKQMIYDGRFVSLMMSSNKEACLYQIMTRMNLHPEKLAIQTESTKMLDFNNCSRPEFRPHHGIHLGIFRQDLRGKRKTILDCDTYQYYIREFHTKILTDPVFLDLYHSAPLFIKKQFDGLIAYYHLTSI